jgi:hypothetical protein
MYGKISGSLSKSENFASPQHQKDRWSDFGDIMRKRSTRRQYALSAGFAFASLTFGCNRVALAPEPGTPTLNDFLPPGPVAGGSPVAAAGVLSVANLAAERVDGPASQGLPGDIFLRNDKIRVVIQQPGREMALVPTGGNIVDADVVRPNNDPLFDADNNPANGHGNDHWGELSILFQLGRVVDVKSCNIIANGSEGGAALVRCFGTDDIDDFINLPGVGISASADPDKPLGADIAIDYLLEPGKDFVQVRYTVFNPSEKRIEAPVGILGDIGGLSEPFVPNNGYGGAGFNDLLGGNVKPAPYGAVQAPDIGYGVVPFYLDPDTQDEKPDMEGLTVVISGGLAIAFDTLDIGGLLGKTDGIKVAPLTATTVGFDFVVGKRDIGVTETHYQEARQGQTTVEVSGEVTIGNQAANARVAVFESDDNVLDDTERPITVFATDSQGNYSGKLAPGSYLLVADAEGASRAAPKKVDLTSGAKTADFALPDSGHISYTVKDVTLDSNGTPVPAKINIVGDDINPTDKRFRDTKASSNINLPTGVVSLRYTRTGASASDPEGLINIEPGHYRIVVSRGIEYSRFESIFDVAAGETVNFDAKIAQVVNSAGYIKGDFHQHSINSPDSPVDLDSRALTYAAEGIEFFASTDHDFRTNYEPILERLNLDQFVDSVVGEETTTFDYGHFNAFPFEVDSSKPNNGAIDWGRGGDFLNLLPTEIFSKMRSDGARVVQINHPRTPASLSFQEFFDQARISYDFDNGFISSDIATATNDIFRLEQGVAMFSDNFDSIELYNGFDVGDLNDDGVKEEVRVEMILRDYFNMLSLGKVATIVGTSDTHSTADPVGQPGTFIRVPNDSANAILTGQLRDPIFAALSGRNNNNTPAPRDVVVSNAPFVSVTVNNQSAIGSLVKPVGGVVTLHIRVEAPDWAEVDTVDIFTNQIFKNQSPGDLPEGSAAETLLPNLCFTSRINRDANDACDANGAAGNLAPFITINDAIAGTTNYKVQVIEFDLQVNVADFTAPGAPANSDGWIVVRAYGTGSLFPVIPGISNASMVDVVTNGSSSAQGGVFPLAVTNAILVDVNNDNLYKGAFVK